MKVAIVHSFYDRQNSSGENRAVEAQTELLLQSGHDVRLFAAETSDLRNEFGYQARSATRVVTGRGRAPITNLLRFDPDVVHVHNVFPNIAANWIQKWQDKVVVTLHNYRSLCSNALMFRDGAACHECLVTPVLPALKHACYSNSALRTLPVALSNSPWGSLRRSLASATEHIVLNDHAKEIFDRHLGTSATVIPNFVTDFRHGSPDRTPSAGWTYAGRLSPEKGILELIAEWPRNQTLQVFGDGPMRAEVEAAARPRTEVIVHGAVEAEVLRAHMVGSAGVIIPSLCQEGLPTVALEAFAAGVPCVLSAHISSAEELVRAGGAVQYSPAANELAPNLQRVTAAAPQYRTAARRLYLSRYHPDSWLESILQVYERVAHGA